MFTDVLSVFLKGQKSGGGFMLIMLVGMIVVMYFFMIRPQQKRQKEQKKFANSTGTGDKVVTSSGIHGRITRDNDDGTVVLEIGRNNSITVERSAISMEMTNNYHKRSGNAGNIEAKGKAKDKKEMEKAGKV